MASVLFKKKKGKNPFPHTKEDFCLRQGSIPRPHSGQHRGVNRSTSGQDYTGELVVARYKLAELVNFTAIFFWQNVKTLLGSRDLVPIPFSSMGPGTRPRFFELVFPRDLGYVEGGLVVATRIARLHNSQSRVTIPRGVYIYVIGGPSKTTFGTSNLLVFFPPRSMSYMLSTITFLIS
jgi:hypothetical protein